jgi:hypothetical protein
LYRKKYLGLMVACTWVFGFGALITTWFGNWGRFGLDTRIGSCSILPDSNGHSPKEFLFIVAFLIPCLAIVICYARIFYIVRKTALKSRLTTRNNTVTANQSGPSGVATSSKSPDGKARRGEGYEDVAVSGRNGKKCNFSPEDSALGTTSTGPTVTTDKGSSFMENGHTCPPPCNNNKSSSDARDDVVDNVTGNGSKADGTLLPPSPRLLSPPSPIRLRLPLQKKILGESSSSSGIEAGAGRNEEYDNEEGACSSRSATPTSLCSCSTVDPCGTSSTSAQHNSFHQQSKNLNCKGHRMKTSGAVNTALSQVASVFRGGGKMKCITTPRCQSTFAASAALATPGKMTAKDKKLLKMILVIFASFVICYLPITISKTFRDTIDVHGLNIAGYILIYLTTCINPIIYVVMSSEYRQAYKNLLMCRTYTQEAVYPQQQPGNGVAGTGRSVSQRA